MTNLTELTKKVLKFRDERDWKQFHNPKDMVISLVLEASEVMEHFQWKTPEEIKNHISESKEEIGDELADVLYWILLMSNDLEINLADALEKKIKQNEQKYPIEKSKGKHTKYNKL